MMEGDVDEDDGTFINIPLADDTGKIYTHLVLNLFELSYWRN